MSEMLIQYIFNEYWEYANLNVLYLEIVKIFPLQTDVTNLQTQIRKCF